MVFGTGGEAGHLNPATFGNARALHANNKTKKSEHPSIGAKRYMKLLMRQAFLLSFAASCSAAVEPANWTTTLTNLDQCSTRKTFGSVPGSLFLGSCSPEVFTDSGGNTGKPEVSPMDWYR